MQERQLNRGYEENRLTARISFQTRKPPLGKILPILGKILFNNAGKSVPLHHKNVGFATLYNEKREEKEL
ncbi:hypothetical protein D2S45_08960 [Prevotella intermedia]|uniref:Uncharacterized protein n=1 Tax=Prevotella intermedia TaxID=28131 RepID=A0A3R8N3W3_PREIN|nr:hypothetical protein D2S53_08950 [Prevotella intermedia]RRF86866.1 hypothetical protein D2S45_08960 [Prevotella intermedia]